MTHPITPRFPARCLFGLALAMCAVLSTGCQTCCGWRDSAWAWWHRDAGLSVPETLPLGSTVRAHYHTMQTNAEAADFILHDHDFVGATAELTPAGRDRILEISARARSAPFPVIVERCCNNANPELDSHRRTIVAQILHDNGLPEAHQRVIVAPAYGKGITAMEGEMDFYQNTYSRGAGGYGGNGFGNNAAGFGGFGAGGFNSGGFGAGGGVGFF
jgi:uncharacterized membrane protein YgcG